MVDLTKREGDALRDIHKYPSGYCWKPATMRKLYVKGLVEPMPRHGAPVGPTVYWRITAAGDRWIASESGGLIPPNDRSPDAV